MKALHAIELVCLLAAPAWATGWVGFRGGPARDSVSDETGLAQNWGNTKGNPPAHEPGERRAAAACVPRLVWESYDIGSGHGSPAFTDDVMYILGGKHLKAIDAATGILLWQAEGAGNSTPSIHDGRIYAQASYSKAPGQLICHDAATGEKIWSVDILQQIPGIGDWKGGTRYGDWHGSTLIVNDKVVVLAGHRSALLVAFNAADGKVAWRSTPAKAASGRGWSSPMLARCDGASLILAQTSGHLVGVDPATGKIYWEEQIKATMTGYPLCNIPIVADGLVFCTARYNKISWTTYKLLDSGRKLERASWSNVAVRPYQESMVHVNGMIFGYGEPAWDDMERNPDMLVSGGPLSALKKHLVPRAETPSKTTAKSGVTAIRFKTHKDKLPRKFGGSSLVCMDLKTGRVLGARFGFPARSFWGLTITVAENRLYVLPATAPQRVYLVEPTPAMTIHGVLTHPPPNAADRTQEKFWFDNPFATPTVHNGLLYVRWHDRMTAFDIRSAARAEKEDAASLGRLPGLLRKWIAAADPSARDARLPMLADFLRPRDRSAVAKLTIDAYAAVPPAAKPRMLRLAVRTGAPAAADAMIRAVDSPDAALADTAVALLADWADPKHLPKVMTILASSSGKRYDNALRGALAIVSRPDAGTPAGRLASIKSIYQHAKTDKDRTAVLGALATIRSWPAVEWAMPKLDDRSEAVKSAAADSIVTMAPETFNKKPVETVKLVERITQSFTKSPAVLQAARKCHKDLMALAKKRGLLTKIITATTPESNNEDELDLGL